jgi:hypothetical protein
MTAAAMPLKLLAALATLGLFTGCAVEMGGTMQANPVCLQPHGGANVRLAPMYKCRDPMMDGRIVNR